MNHRLFILFFLLAFAGLVSAQEISLEQFNAQRHAINRTAMLTLGGWALTNIGLNSALYGGAKSDERKYFYQMNAAWNVINLAIAGIGYYGSLHPDTTLTLYQSLQDQAEIEKILLFNAGLDIGYVMTGFYLLEKSKNASKHAARLKGYGQSIIFQGAFLFIFDIIVYLKQYQNFKLAEDLVARVSVQSNGIGLTLFF